MSGKFSPCEQAGIVEHQRRGTDGGEPFIGQNLPSQQVANFGRFPQMRDARPPRKEQ